jgi:hypothetical protein
MTATLVANILLKGSREQLTRPTTDAHEGGQSDELDLPDRQPTSLANSAIRRSGNLGIIR